MHRGPAWADHAIWWHAHPLGFLGAPRAGTDEAGTVHRLEALRPWLPYLVELGANGLLLGPVFAAHTHGYDTVDHLRVDPRLGIEDDLVALVESCRSLGVRVVLDGVFHHVGRGHRVFTDVLEHGRDSAYASWLRIDWDEDGPDGFGYATFEGHRDLVALNHAEPAVADYTVDVMKYWLDRGVAGFRLDAAYAVPTAFWRQVIDRVRAAHPGAWFAAEVIHGDYAALASDAGWDTVTQYELWKAVWSSLNDRNMFELAWALERHAGFSAAGPPLTFVGNHDVTRIASRLDDERHLAHAVVLLCTLPGIPCVYAGDEQAFRGVKYDRAGGDDEVRAPFPPTPHDLLAGGWPTYRLHQRLIGLRRRHPWLTRARLSRVALANEYLCYCLEPTDGADGADGAGGAGGGRLLVALSTSDAPARVEVGGGGGRLAAAPLAGEASVGDGVLELPPHGWAVLSAAP
jgi:glycosidase